MKNLSIHEVNSQIRFAVMAYGSHFTPLGSPLKSTQVHFKQLCLVKGQRAIKITSTFSASGLTVADLNVLDSQVMVNLA